MSNHRYAVQALRFRFLLTFLTFLFASPLTSQSAHAQTAPEVVFETGHLSGDCLSNPTVSRLANGTRNDGGTLVQGQFTYTDTSSATATNGSLTMSTGLVVDRSSGTGGSYCGGYGFSVFTKHPADMTLSGNGSASGSFSGGSSGSVGYGAYPISAGTFSYGQGGTPTNSSGAGDQTVNLTCSAAATTFPEYPGVNYYRAFQSNGQLYRLKGTASLGGSGAASATVNGTGSLSVAYATGTPVAVIGPTTFAATVGYPVTFTNNSYDPDGPGGNQGTCSAVWTVTKTSGSVTTSTNNASVTFTPSDNQDYTVNLTVTDNEGQQASTSLSFRPRYAPTPAPGLPYRTQEEEISCGDSPGNGSSAGGDAPGKHFYAVLNASTGNVGAGFRDPIKTRGYPLTLDVRINNQVRIPNRNTALGNADFTYSIGVHYRSYYDGAGLLQKERYLVDADGTAIYLGNWTNPPSLPSYFKATLNSSATVLTNAGPPGRISFAGNYKYEFTSGGALYRITDPQGNIQQTTYDGNNRLSTVTDQSTGKTLTFLYNGTNYAYRVVQNGGESKIDFTYTSNRVTNISVKNSALSVMQYLDITYNGSNLISTIRRDGDNATTMTYSYVTMGNGVALGNVSWSGGATRANYFGVPGSGATMRTVVADSNGNKTMYDYTSAFLPVRKILPTMFGASNPVTYTYTVNSSDYTVTSISDGATTTNFSYNSKAKVTQVNNNAGGVWNFSYTANGINLLGIQDSIGTVLTLVYGNTSQPNLPTSITGADGQTWTRTYNSYGQLLTIVPPSGSSRGTTTLTYETSTGSPNYAMLKTVTNGAGDVTQYTGHSSLGEVTSIVQTPETGTNITTSFAYDGSQRLTSVTLPDSKQRTYSYNYRKLSSITDEAGNNTAYSFCATCGKLSGMSMPLSKSLSWQQDGDQRTVGFTDARTNQTVYIYGNAGELKSVTYPDGSYKTIRYDDYGRIRQFEDARGNTEDYSYDTAGRVQTITLNPSGGTSVDIDYTYNADNSVASVSDEVGVTSYSYNTGRRVSNVAYDWSTSGLTNTQNVSYTYTPDGLIDTMTWKDASTTVASWDYGYDGAGRMTSVGNSFSETTNYTFDGVGKLKTQSNQNSTTLTYAYNQQRGWPTQIQWKLSGTPFAQYDLVYDDGNNTVGNLTDVTELDSSTVEYTYDSLYRLTAEARTGTGAYTKSYGYDLAGNMTTYGGSSFATYDNTNKISSLSGGSVSHDADGNMTSVSGAGIPATTLTWSMRDRLLRQQTSSDDLSYGYDAGGKRVLRYPTSSPTAKTFYVFSGGVLIGEVTSSVPSYAYTWGPGGLVSQRDIGNSASLWYHSGPQAETRQLTNTGGSIVDEYRFDGYGRATYVSGSHINPFRYGGGAGYYTDGSSGLVLATQRWYSPELSRWTTRDPIEYEGGDNLMGYVMANPIGYIDPSGLNPSASQCMWSCLEQQGYSMVVSAAGVAGTVPLFPKRFVTPGSSTGTSIASKLGRKLPGRFCVAQWAPTLKMSGRTTTSVGAFGARWLAPLALGMAINDAVQVGLCTAGCADEDLE